MASKVNDLNLSQLSNHEKLFHFELISVLKSVDYNEEEATKLAFGLKQALLFKILNKTEFIKREDYSVKLKNSIDKNAGLKNLIEEYEGYINPSKHRIKINNDLIENPYYFGYLAAQNNKDVPILYYLDSAGERKYLIRECLAGASIADWLPKMKDELAEMEKNMKVAIDNKITRDVSSDEKLVNNKIHNSRTTPHNPIWWLGSDRQLAYLMDELARKGFIDKNTQFNKVIIDHFINKDKKTFSSSIKQNKSGTADNKRTNGKPKGHENIDNIINDLPKTN